MADECECTAIKKLAIGVNGNNTENNGNEAVADGGKATGRVDKTDALATGFDDEPPKAHQYTAAMPTERYAREYNMNHKNRGRALIFNHEKYDIPSLKERTGTNVDCQNLQNALQNLGFSVTIHSDYKLKDIMNKMEEVRTTDHSDNDCLLVAILSHGEHGYIYAKDVQYKLDTLSHYFGAHVCPTLAGKPKIFIIQACQGDHLDSGVLMQKTETDGESSASYKIPIHADFIFAFSTIPGFFSWRNTTNGSWFIQSLVTELNKNGKKDDFLTLLTFVNQRVALDFESNVPDSPLMHQQKQISCVSTMLTRILRFPDKNPVPT